jgi:hypothetical protein
MCIYCNEFYIIAVLVVMCGVVNDIVWTAEFIYCQREEVVVMVVVVMMMMCSEL